MEDQLPKLLLAAALTDAPVLTANAVLHAQRTKVRLDATAVAAAQPAAVLMAASALTASAVLSAEVPELPLSERELPSSRLCPTTTASRS